MNILFALVVFALKVALGLVLALLLVVIAVVLNMPSGGGGSGLIALGWLVFGASVVWALRPFFVVGASARKAVQAERLKSGTWRCPCGAQNAAEQTLCVSCSAPR